MTIEVIVNPASPIRLLAGLVSFRGSMRDDPEGLFVSMLPEDVRKLPPDLIQSVRFYEELSAIPHIPEGMYECGESKITVRVRKRHIARRGRRELREAIVVAPSYEIGLRDFHAFLSQKSAPPKETC